MYTLTLTATVPGTNKTKAVSQEFVVDNTAPEIESCIKVNVNGEEKILMKVSDNYMLQGGVMLDGYEWYDSFVSAEDSSSQYILLDSPGKRFTAEIYDMAGNCTTVTEKQLDSETYTISYDSDGMFFASDEKTFKNKISFTDSSGKKVAFNIALTPEQVYKKGLDGFNISLGSTDILYVEAQVGLRGDANCSGNIDVFDAIYIAQYTVAPNSAKYKDFENSLGGCLADMNKDGSIDVFDAIAIARYTVS
jgi:hypothetical protein